jgi:hypothetical protein
MLPAPASDFVAVRVAAAVVSGRAPVKIAGAV